MSFDRHQSHKLEKGLYLEERKGAKHFKARALLNGKYHFTNTGATERQFKRAERVARSWFRSLQRDGSGNPDDGSMFDVAEGFLASVDKPTKQKNYRVKWNKIREFFAGMDVRDVTSKVLVDFVRERKKHPTKSGGTVIAHTIHKDLVTIRQILNWAALQELITTIPVFPKAGTIEKNPRPWLEPHEWQRLLKLAKERKSERNINNRTRAQRNELYDFMMMMVHSCARVDELRRLRVGDCIVRTLTDFEREQRARELKVDIKQYLDMRINGKTGIRDAVAWSGAVTSYRRLVARGSLGANDLLFKEHHRDGFRELLELAGLRHDALGNPRNLKSLRSTGLMLRIKDNPEINLKLLAESAGTSVAMLDTFYLKRLNVRLHYRELI